MKQTITIKVNGTKPLQRNGFTFEINTNLNSQAILDIIDKEIFPILKKKLS